MASEIAVCFHFCFQKRFRKQDRKRFLFPLPPPLLRRRGMEARSEARREQPLEATLGAAALRRSSLAPSLKAKG